MVRPVEQIEQEIAKLDQAVAAIAQEFHDTYKPYLAALGKAVRQQLILASYHLCTQGYPEQFLQLSLRQRQDLQQSLQQLAKQTQIQLSEQLQPVRPEPKAIEPESEPAEEPEVDQASHPAEEPETDQAIDSLPPSSSLPPSPSLSLRPSPAKQSPESPITPLALAHWQDQLEQNIAEQLQNLSHAANCLLQQGKILPSQLPEPVLEVASRTDLASEVGVSPPNLLSLLIESDSEESTLTQLTAIRLRLSEIEFSDTTVARWRSKVRTLIAQLNKLGREYQKRQKEKAIAQAELAWRSSWYEE
ncbi:MAG: hypothetical protein HY785_03700 [Oscillatoriophycideae cyanobacterium NC_groundwater_1537_Pr4_S-0.65um_50_18]|nr:hypothetical protein [Oscillatoriophycideae cyanobacterium NC_groundwater_1537_Pr4_S-0.65um_50_18]